MSEAAQLAVNGAYLFARIPSQLCEPVWRERKRVTDGPCKKKKRLFYGHLTDKKMLRGSTSLTATNV